MKFLSLLSLSFLFGCFYATAQSQPGSKLFKYGVVNPEEFEIAPTGQDTAADAVKLFDIGSCVFKLDGENFAYIFERHVRIKILKKTAYDWANLSVTLYTGNNGKETLENITGSTFNIDGGKVVESKLGKDARFKEQYDKNYLVKKIALPNIKEGSIIEYKYRIKSTFIYNLRAWNFQTSIPTIFSEYSVSIPEYFAYKINATGYWPISIAEEKTIGQNFTYSAGTQASESFSADVLYRRYVAQNVPAFKDESFITTDDDYISKLDFELNHTNFPSSGYKEYSSTWPQISKTLAEDENFGLFIAKGNFIDLVRSIVKDESDAEKQMRLIYNYVKNTVKWNEDYHRYASDDNPKNVLDRKTGSSADINLTLISLLRAAGLRCEPMLISTRSNGTHPGYPLLTKFNNVIGVVTINDRKFFLDATGKNYRPDLIGYQNLNHKGLIVNTESKTAEWEIFKDSLISRTSYFYNLTLNPENVLQGNFSMVTTEYNALNTREKYTGASNQDDFLKNYTSDKTGLEIRNYNITNLENVNEQIIQSMEVKISDMVEEAGDIVYFSPLLFERTKENPFKLENRNYPVDFAYPQEEIFRLVITLPDNYKIEKLPTSESVVLKDKSASYTYKFAEDGNKISITSKISLLKSIYNADEYHDLKELFKNIVRKQAEQIVLKKG